MICVCLFWQGVRLVERGAVLSAPRTEKRIVPKEPMSHDDLSRRATRECGPDYNEAAEWHLADILQGGSNEPLRPAAPREPGGEPLLSMREVGHDVDDLCGEEPTPRTAAVEGQPGTAFVEMALALFYRDQLLAIGHLDLEGEPPPPRAANPFSSAAGPSSDAS